MTAKTSDGKLKGTSDEGFERLNYLERLRR